MSRLNTNIGIVHDDKTDEQQLVLQWPPGGQTQN